MAGKEVWFRGSDGFERCCEEGSVAFDLMTKDGSFTPIDGPGGSESKAAPDENAESKPIDLSKMTKKQLLEHAALLDVPVTDKMKNADIIAAIEAKAEDGSES
jgi:hypothetical protein